MAGAGKVTVSLVSLLLLVGIVIGVVVGVKNSGKKREVTVTTSTKTATGICSLTQHQDACLNSLGHVANNESATPKDYIFAIIQGTIAEVNKTLSVAHSVNVDDKNEFENMGVDDCKKCLQFAIDDLQDAISMIDENDLTTISNRVFDLRNWLTAVVAYKGTCLDEVVLPEYRTPIENGMVNATQVTSNALDILAELDNILDNMGVQPDNVTTDSQQNVPGTTNRRLLEVIELGHDGYPTWFSAADRKLLAAIENPKKNKKMPMAGGGHHPAGVHHKKHQGRKAAAMGGKGAAAVGGNAPISNVPGVGLVGGNPGTYVGRLKPNAVVAQDGSGQYKSISAAVNAIPTKHLGKWIIYVKAGIYKEHILIPKGKTDVFMYGDGPRRTIVTGALSQLTKTKTMQSATFAVEGARFIGKGMGFRNTAGPEGHQAVAFRSQSDMSALFDCSFEAYQDTLYYHSNRQFYRNCVIMGTVDFIFGKGTALIQDSEIIVRMPMAGQKNTLTADGNEEPKAIAGLVIQGCHIIPEKALSDNKAKVQTYFGRPWSASAVTAIIQTNIENFINPAGWMIWDGENNHQSCTYVEYMNSNIGGTQTGGRVRWRNVRINNPVDARRFTAAVHLEGGDKPVKWVMNTGVPNYIGLKGGK